MLENLKDHYRLQLMKNGVYYAEKNNNIILNYMDFFDGPDADICFREYISYRVKSTGKEIAETKIQNIIDGFKRSLINFKKGNNLVSDPKNDDDWLLMPTFLLLSLGGDDRSIINPSSLKNKYHTSTLPNYDYQRSSCTSSTISLETYLHIEQEHFHLIVDYLNGSVEKNVLFNNQKEEIKSYFVSPAYSSSSSILTTPSGTDVEMLCSWLGVLRHHQLYQNEKSVVCVFVNGDLEVGSGTKPAADLKHFNPVAPIGSHITKEQQVHSTTNQVDVQSFYVRDEKTAVYNSKESEESLYQKVKNEIDNNKVVVFHYVHASKTGVCTPSYSLAERIKNDFKDKVILVVDAAQVRLQSDYIEKYLTMGMNVIVTGSKFIGGSPFSGALLVCKKDAHTFIESEKELPKEYDIYFDQHGIHPMVKRSDESRPWSNWGLYLRWQVALHEMKRFDRIPTEFSDKLITQWVLKVRELIEESSHSFHILKENELLPSDESSLSASNSIVSFELLTQPPLDINQLKSIHKKMTIKRSEDDLICEIGQPVQISTGEKKRYALRLALGAKNVIDAYYATSSYKFTDCLNHLLVNDKKILNKIFELINEELNHASS